MIHVAVSRRVSVLTSDIVLLTTLVPEFVVVGFTGVWGIIGSTAPFPEVDAAEAPKTFMA
jgi:hypothetical protein